MNRLFLMIICAFLLTNCTTKGTYKPLVNFETSKDEEANKQYWKNLQACNYIYQTNTGALADKLGIAEKQKVIKKCMSDYGYSILR